MCADNGRGGGKLARHTCRARGLASGCNAGRKGRGSAESRRSHPSTPDATHPPLAPLQMAGKGGGQAAASAPTAHEPPQQQQQPGCLRLADKSPSRGASDLTRTSPRPSCPTLGLPFSLLPAAGRSQPRS